MQYVGNGTLYSIGDPNDISFIASSLFNNGKIVTKEARAFIEGLYSLDEFDFPDNTWTDEQVKWFLMVKDSLFMDKGAYVRSIIDAKREKYLEDLSTGKKTNGLTLQINSFCNFACKYCIAEHKVDERKSMSLEIAKQAIDAFLKFRLPDESFDYFHVSYVGKEPLISFSLIKETEAYLSEIETELAANGRHITHVSSFISNLSLVTPNMIRFFKEKHFEITGSLDGNKSANDLNRVFKVGKFSVYDTVIEKLKMFYESGYPIKTLNMVITQSSLQQLDSKSFINDIKSCGVETLGVSFDERKPGEIPTDEKLNILNEMMTIAGQNSINISGEFGKAFSTLTGKSAPVAHCKGEGGANILVDANGQIKLCNYLSNIDADIKSISEAFAPGGAVYENVRSYLIGNSKCKGCYLEGSCLGGCAAVVNDDYTNSQRDIFCTETKLFTENLVKNAISAIKRNIGR